MKSLLIIGVLIASLCVACVPSSTTRQVLQQAKQAAEHPNNMLRPLLALENQAYRDARTALLAFVDVQDEIDDFAPADAEERMFKRAIQGWVDHETEYDSVLPRLLADEENGRTVDGEGFIGYKMRRPSPPGKIFDALPNPIEDDVILHLPRMFELFLFEKDNLEVETTLLPPPAPRWRFGRVKSTMGLAYDLAYYRSPQLVSAQDLVDDAISIVRAEVFKPLDASGELGGRYAMMAPLDSKIGDVALFNLYKSRWTHPTPVTAIGEGVDLRWSFRDAWISLGEFLWKKNLVTEADRDLTGLPIPPRPPRSSGY